MRKKFAALAVVVLGVLASVTAAQAATIGQTGVPDPGFFHPGGLQMVPVGYVVPAGGGVIVSLNTQSSAGCFFQGVYNLQVLHPTGNPGEYEVLGDTGNQTDPCDGQLHSYPVNIPVQAGDVLGAYVVSDWFGALDNGGFAYDFQPEPVVGGTFSVSNLQPAFTVDESATLAQVPTSIKDCKHGGWKNLTDNKGKPFKSQNACTDFVEDNDDQGNDNSQ